ncbi:MAG TPA: NAD-dependent epimerase/dehydratase family protein [Pseudonocardiaceae bacterium]|nr:NAD-dependent epimerase/dehydratase family protein [Pseudonocardiaceae bacterium]
MALHVVVGAGPVGTATAQLLADRGDQVRVVTRRGAGPTNPGIERFACDATDPAALARLAETATAIYNCAQPAYHRWPQDFPALLNGLIGAAESTGAVLVQTGNLYAYGLVDRPMTEALPLRPNSVKGRARARVWETSLAAHEAGRIRTAEVRGSDYLGANTLSVVTVLLLPAILMGRRAMVPADLDAPHSWTYVGDMARTLVAVADRESAWGRPWHVPTPPPMSIRELAQQAATVAGAPSPKLATMPSVMLWLGGLFDKGAKEMREMRYQFQHPFILDSTAAQAEFGITPTPTDAALADTVTALQTPVPA